MGCRFRNEIEVGPSGEQIQIEDLDGNPIELHEANPAPRYRRTASSTSRPCARWGHFARRAGRGACRGYASSPASLRCRLAPEHRRRPSRFAVAAREELRGPAQLATARRALGLRFRLVHGAASPVGHGRTIFIFACDKSRGLPSCPCHENSDEGLRARTTRAAGVVYRRVGYSGWSFRLQRRRSAVRW